MQRVMFFDPKEVYKRIENFINHNHRHQTKIHAGNIFPKLDSPFCDCGCYKELKGRRTRWATHDCSQFVNGVLQIIIGYTDSIYRYLAKYHGECCSVCKRNNGQIYNQDIKHLPSYHHQHKVRVLNVDHILAVTNGGGGGWLTNYQLLCYKCHIVKTKQDLKK